MKTVKNLWNRWTGRRPEDEEIEEELRAHLEIATQERMERGETRRQAERGARLELGNVGMLKEDTRAVWMWRTFEVLLQDLKYATRRLGKSPGFTALAVLTLAFGLSVNATIFGLISSMFLRPLPVKDAERLVLVLQRNPNSDFLSGLSWSDYQDYRAEIDEFSDVLALAFRPAHMSVDGHAPDRTWIEAVSGNYFSMLGVKPVSGRFFQPGEVEQENADPVVVLGHDYWQTRLGGDPDVVGKTVVINSTPLTVIGIAPESFASVQWSLAPSAFVPATMMPELFDDASILERRDSAGFKVIAHLKPGVTVAQASSAAQVLGRRLAQEYRPEANERQVFVQPERMTRPEPSTSRFLPFAAVVFAVMAGLVLFTSCANVANLMFSKAVVRRNEISTRLAIGAGRWRLIRQLLTESVVLALPAGAVGMLLSCGTGILLARFSAMSGDIPLHPDERWDWLPLVGTMLIAIAAGAGTGLFPALRATRGDLLSMMKGGTAGVGRERHLFRSGLVFGQIAMSVAVLACAGLFVQSLLRLTSYELGFRTDRLVMASFDLDLQGYDKDRGLQLIDELTERVYGLPGVESATVAANVPFGNYMMNRAIALPDALGDEDTLNSGLNFVDGDYFETLGVTLLRGRPIRESDVGSSPRVAVVNETLAERLWPGEEAVGQSFRWQSGGDPVEVVGVARNGKYQVLGEAPRRFAYLPITQEYAGMLTLHLKSQTDDPLTLAPVVREVIGELDAELPVFDVRSMEEHLRGSAFAFLPLRIGAVLASVQGAIALLLAVMGVYGVVASSVSQRTRDIGIRIALGAQKLDVFRLVSRAGLRPALIGLVLGLAVSLALARLLTALLYGLNPVSVPVFATVFVVVLGVSLLACWLPARRAAKMDPTAALRHE